MSKQKGAPVKEVPAPTKKVVEIKKKKAAKEDNGNGKKPITTRVLAGQIGVRPASLRRYLRTMPAFQDEKYTRYGWDEGDKQLQAIKDGFSKFQTSEKEKNKKRLAELKKTAGKKQAPPAKKGKAKKEEEDEEEPEEEETDEVAEDEEEEEEEEEVIE